MFWGLILKASKRYSQTVTKPFHLSQAALDTTTCGEGDIQVMLTSEDDTYLLCTLKKNVPQCALDLNFQEGDKIAFSSKGSGSIHLTGFLIPDADDFLESDFDDAADLDELEVKPQQNKIQNKDKKKVLPKPEEKSDDDEDEDDDDDDVVEGEDDNESGEDDDDDDNEDEDDESDEEESEEEVEEPKKKVAKVEKPKQNGIDKTSIKDKKKQKQPELKKTSNSKLIDSGVRIEDLKVGTGADAKPGKKVSVFYEGRLLTNNKVFDSSKSGPGFKFILGRGEVIRGWDVGVAGMKVGGKRRITCPPQAAYGPKGSPPTIPSNATLVFDVELKNVN